MADAADSFQAFFTSLATSAFSPAETVTAGASSSSSALSAFIAETSGALRFTIMERRHGSMYVRGGGGLAATFGPGETVNVHGQYQFTVQNPRNGAIQPYAESDSVTLRSVGSRIIPAVVCGVGGAYHLSRQWDLAAGVDLAVRHVSTAIYVDASPGVILVHDPQLSQSGIVSFTSDPITFTPGQPPVTAIVFDDNDNLAKLVPSSLSGPALRGVQTFQSRGWNTAASLHVGLAYRF